MRIGNYEIRTNVACVPDYRLIRRCVPFGADIEVQRLASSAAPQSPRQPFQTRDRERLYPYLDIDEPAFNIEIRSDVQRLGQCVEKMEPRAETSGELGGFYQRGL
jgi:hypothetical protein